LNDVKTTVRGVPVACRGAAAAGSFRGALVLGDLGCCCSPCH
jgi:hypothetical protein